MAKDLQIEVLDWDTEFFGLKTGRVIVETSNRDKLSSLRNLMKSDNIQVVYIISEFWDEEIHDILIKSGASLVDKKVTYAKKIIAPVMPEVSLFPLVSKKNAPVTDDIISLAYASGVYSRFLLDEGFGKSQYEKLYFEWLDKSISGNLADEVWAAVDNEEVIGFITVKKDINKQSGQIGLIAVSEKYRGKKIGQSLMLRCEQWYYENKLKYAKVVTQGDNKAACKFYEANGYTVDKVEYYYHLWNNKLL